MTAIPPRLDPTNESDWEPIARHWRIRPDTTYLNHGSFGPPPEPVRAARAEFQRRQDEQPMDFLVRELEPAWEFARDTLAEFVGSAPGNLAFVENATDGMNIVADSFPLGPGDEVLLTDHEYGAVVRIWERRCRETGARLRTVVLPLPFRTAEETVDAIADALNERTKILIVSHITSPTAVILPIAKIAAAARKHGTTVCIDGPHAVFQVPLALDDLGIDYYVASCHKWLSAPFGSGFLWVHPQRQSHVRPPLCWGRIQPREPETWWDEFVWPGTRDASAYLAVPAAIAFARTVGEDNFRRRTHYLAQYSRRTLGELTRREPIIPDDAAWYGTMAHVPLPAGDARTLQLALWNEHRIEVPIVRFRDERYIRVSCHLYNTIAEIDRLTQALAGLLARSI